MNKDVNQPHRNSSAIVHATHATSPEISSVTSDNEPSLLTLDHEPIDSTNSSVRVGFDI